MTPPTIRYFGHGFHHIRGSFRIGGVVDVGTHCSLVEIADGRFAFLDSYTLTGEVLDEAIRNIRETHTPALFHIEEITQPQGHSTSGSHERYKDPERLDWEKKWDCKKQMREWIISNALASLPPPGA